MAHRTVPAAGDTRGPAETAMSCAVEGGEAFRANEPPSACPYDMAGDRKERFRALEWAQGYAIARNAAAFSPADG